MNEGGDLADRRDICPYGTLYVYDLTNDKLLRKSEFKELAIVSLEHFIII